MIDYPRRWLTIRQAAEVLQLSAKCVYAMASRGDLPMARICGGRRKGLRVDRIALERRLEKQIEAGAALKGKKP